MNGDEKKVLTALQLQVGAAFARQETWSKAHDARLRKIESSLVLTNTAVQEIGSAQAIMQGQAAARDKRISAEAERVGTLAGRLRTQEDTGVHHLGEVKGAKAAREATRKGFLFAFAVLGALGVVGGIAIGVLKLSGCSN